MAYDEALAERIRQALEGQDGIIEKKMFGGLAFMLGGNMVCGVVGNDLMARVGPDGHDSALSQPGARPMDFSGRPMRGMVYVGPEAHTRDETLREWIDRVLAFGISLPAKEAKSRPSRRRDGR